MAQPRLTEFLRFCLVGGIAFLIDALILEFLVLGSVPPLIARVISIAIAMQVSYALHRRFTFRNRHAHNTVRWGKFMASNLIGAAINYGVFAGVLQFAFSDDTQITRLIALISGTMVALVFNYWVNRCYVFAPDSKAFAWLHRPPIALMAALAIVIPHLIYVLSKWYQIPLHEGIPVGQTDPDTWLRLTLVRDWLMGGSWYDHSVARSDAPLGGTISPWTRPLDVVIAALVYLQPETVDITLRLMRAALLLPVLCMGLLVIGIHRAIRSIMPLPLAYIMASIMVVTLPMMWNYFSLGNADHHGLLAALFIWVMGGVLTTTPSRRLMLFTGVLLGIQLWVSVEAMMLIALIYTWYGLNWLRGDTSKATALAWLSTGTALSSLWALMVERRMGEWFTPIYDSISIAQVYALVLSALLAWVLHLAPTKTLRARLTLTATGGALLIALIALAYPKLLLGPMVDVHPFILSDFLPRISEAKPFYKISSFLLAAMLLIPLVGLWACLGPWLRTREWFYAWEHALALTFFIAGTVLLYLGQQRWSYYLLPIAIVSVAPLLGALFTPEHALVRKRWPARLLVNLSPNQQSKKRLPFTLAVLGLPFILAMLAADPTLSNNSLEHTNSVKNIELLQTKQRDGCYEMARQLIRGGELVKVLSKQPLTLLLPTDLGTEMLLFTPHRIVASNYHREGAGIAYVWGADTISDEAALRAHLKQRDVGALLLCPSVKPEENSLLQTYARGAILPPWLIRIEYRFKPSNPADNDDMGTPAVQPVPPLLLRVTAP